MGRASRVVSAREDLSWARRAGATPVQPGLLWSRSTPGASHLAARMARRRLRHHVPWVMQISDPWVGNPVYSGFGRQWTEALRSRWERCVCLEADVLVFTCDQLRDLYVSRYPAVAKRSVVVPHSFDPEAYPHASASEKVKDRQLPRLAYVGSVYGPETLETIIRACRGLSLELRMCGSVSPPQRDMILDSGVCATFSGVVSYRESLREMSDADLLLIVDPYELDWAHSFPVSPAFPAKLVDYLGSRRPLFGIASARSVTGAVLSKYGFPLSDSVNAAELLAKTLRRLPELTAVARNNDYTDFEPDAVRKGLFNAFRAAGIAPRLGQKT